MTAELVTVGGTAVLTVLAMQLPALYAKHVDNAKDKRKHQRDIAWQAKGGEQ